MTDDQGLIDEDEEPDVKNDPVPEPPQPEPEDDGSTTEPEADGA